MIGYDKLLPHTGSSRISPRRMEKIRNEMPWHPGRHNHSLGDQSISGRQVMAGVDEQSKEYSKLSSLMGRILANLTKFKQDNPLHNKGNWTGSPRSRRCCVQIFWLRTQKPIQFGKFQRDIIVYYKESWKGHYPKVKNITFWSASDRIGRKNASNHKCWHTYFWHTW